MTKYYKIIFFLLLSVNWIHAQSESKLLKGKINAKTEDLERINIINIHTDYATESSEGGYFEINASVGDTLVFSGVQFERKTIVVTKENYDAAWLFVALKIAIRQIEEVSVGNKINAVSLGIVSKNQKKYTVAERRLYAATGSSNTYGTSTKVSLDAILNSISGRTTMLKKELIIEKKEMIIKKVSEWFEDIYFTETLKIPSDYIAGFKYYLVENDKFVASVNNKNKTLASFLIGEIATDYIRLLNGK